MNCEITWGLANSCEGKFTEGQRVRTRGDMGRFDLVIEKIYNQHYAQCRDVLPFGIKGRRRHMNMNCLETFPST